MVNPKDEASQSNVEEASYSNLENTKNTAGTEEVSVYTTAVKLTNFYHHAPVFWFAQAESQFSVKSITVDETKFHFILCYVFHTKLAFYLSKPEHWGVLIEIRKLDCCSIDWHD